MPSQSEDNSKHSKLVAQLKECYERLFATEDGKRVLNDITLSGGVNRSALNSDAILMAYNVARQDFANHIVEMAKPTEKKPESPTEALK